jgi:superkiller protein 3
MHNFFIILSAIFLFCQCSFRQKDNIPTEVILEGKEFEKNAIETLQKYISEEKNNDEAHYKLYKIYFNKQDYGKAYEFIKKSVSIKPEELLYQKGMLNCLIKLGLYQDAEDILDKISGKASESDLSTLALEIYYHTNRTDKALKIIDSQLNIGDSSAQILTQKAQILFLKQDTIGSIKMLTKALEKDSNSVQIYELLAQYNNLLDNNDLVTLFAKKALKIDSNSAKANFYQALSLKKKNQKDSAIYFYEKVLKLDSSYVDALYNVSIIYLQKNKFDKSEKYLKKLMVLKSSNPNLEFKLAVSLMNLDKNEEALKYFEKVDTSNINYIFAQKSIKKIKIKLKPTTAVVEQETNNEY